VGQGASLFALGFGVLVVVQGALQGVAEVPEQGAETDMAAVGIDTVAAKGGVPSGTPIICRQRFLRCLIQTMSICLFLLWSGSLWYSATWLFTPMNNGVAIRGMDDPNMHPDVYVAKDTHHRKVRRCHLNRG
jgi:hypothetical protein